MRILFLEDPNAVLVMGGAEIQARKTAQALNDLDIHVDFAPSDNIPKINNYSCIHIFNLFHTQYLEKIIEYTISQNKPVLISSILWDMTHEAFHLSPRWQFLSNFLGKKITWTLFKPYHHLRTMSEDAWKIQKNVLHLVDAILPNSHMEGAFLMNWYKLKKEDQNKIFPIPNGIDCKLFDPLPKPDLVFCEQNNLQTNNFLLQVGRIEPTKNQLGLLHAFQDSSIPIVFIGRSMDPGYMEKCQYQAKKHGKVVFIDFIEHHKLPRIYAAAAVHVLPSWRETPGLVNLEAAASGCKVVTTNIGCAQEYLRDDVWYCDPDNFNSIRQSVISALKGNFSENLRDRILKSYNWEQAATKTFEAYKHILS